MRDPAEIMALAIKSADNSWFNEDYSKQASAALAALTKAGYRLVPAKANDKLINFMLQNMPFGRMKPEDYLAEIYKLIIDNARTLAD